MAVGLQAESSWILIVIKAAAGLLALCLLVFGQRRPRFSGGLLWLAAALGTAYALLAGRSYLLAVLAALAALFVLLWLQERLPRLAMAVAGLLPFPLLWFGFILHAGSFHFRPLVALLGALAGALCGAVWPWAMAAPLAAMLAAALLALAAPFAIPFPWLAALALLACALQFLDLARRRHGPAAAGAGKRPLAAIAREWRRWATAVAASWLLLALLVPAASSSDPIHRRRMAALNAPMLGVSPGRNYYLTGQARPLALLAPRPSLLNRPLLLVAGRSQERAVDGLRLVKDAGEISRVRRACRVVALAMEEVPALARPGVSEREIESRILKAFREHGAPRPSFAPIVASGANAVRPHYDRNGSVLAQGFLVVDIGCMVDGYASDMTRTFPIGGLCTPAQAKVLDAVIAAKTAAERLLRPGVTVRRLNQAARREIERAGFAAYWLHGISHGVGIDVHDPTPETLRPGMVITIEPGVYIPAGARIDRAYWDLGARVEDTYLITAEGFEILTRGCEG
jgi:Xaa-Pro aminopeptidase